jgi:hypothetical protein
MHRNLLFLLGGIPMRKPWRMIISTFFFLAAGVQFQSLQAGLTINFTGTTGNASADAGFQRAANAITSRFTDNVTITIQRGFANLGAGILGQAGSSAVRINYSDFRTNLINDIHSADDLAKTNSLHGGNTYTAYFNRTSQNGNSANGYVATRSQLEITTANARALGFNIAAGTDATITFSSNFTWDFDNSDGIAAGAQDFVGVATHELMHAMGFVSGVDDIDFSPGLSETNYFANSLDFARFSNASLAAGADLDMTADARAKFFSIDGGATNLTTNVAGGFSTGVNFGDGRQASHWKDNLGLGIMDPTANPAGQLNLISELDLRALDIIGWDRFTAVPEPSSLLCVGISGGLMLVVRRRKAKKEKLEAQL